ncbi:ABC transporter ATP-binding protein [Shinella sp. CPCC 100929]|uniref:ABC transporter ATP-binding protein n=1 Tax=Shinella lacus TaxID=2654216 RepID=A0ABT1RHN3_9HYPH|nr:ABC transporter ATP-binding protein [Shinella lacus]MCQ4634675.1 ABC transporter ATP-binding protein [Shinella lacus]
MIVCHDIHKHFGGFRAIDGVSLKIPEGAITGLLGPNGAGKSTLFNVIAGVHKPTSGKVTLAGEDITGLPPHALFARGVLRTFQIAHEFSSMSVLENLMMVPGGQSGETLWNTWFHRSRIAREEEELRARAEDVLDFLTLTHVRDERAGNLSGGQKKLVELGRTMMVDARVVFLDEVGAGVNRTLLATIGDAIVRLNRERGYTFCVIEHDMDFIARLCDSVIVMAEGRVLAEGAPADIMQNEQVIEAYLGTGLKNKVIHGEAAAMGGAASA